MPFSNELGMRVYDPAEGAREGLEIGGAFERAMEGALRRRLTEREIEIQERQQQRLEDEAARQARFMVRRQRGLQNMAVDYQDLLKVGATPDVAQRMSMMQNLPDILEGAPPGVVENVLKSDEANQVKLMTQQLLNERLTRTLDMRDRLGMTGIEARKEIAAGVREDKALDREFRERMSEKAEAGREKRSDQVGLEVQRANAAFAEGDEELANLHKSRAARLSQATGQTIKVNPDGTIEMTTGPLKPGSIETGAAKSLATQQDTFDVVNQAIKAVDPSSVGIRGHLGALWERVANIVAPGSVRPITTEKRQAMGVALQDIITGFRKDAVGGRLNIQEQNMLKGIGDVTGWIESADTARTKLNSLLAIQAGKSIREAKTAKAPTPDWALREITKAQAEQGFKDKWMTEDDLRRAYRLHPDWASG